jgi:hypothetical protein
MISRKAVIVWHSLPRCRAEVLANVSMSLAHFDGRFSAFVQADLANSPGTKSRQRLGAEISAGGVEGCLRRPGLRREKVVWSGMPMARPSRVASERSRPSVCLQGRPKARRSRCPVSIAMSAYRGDRPGRPVWGGCHAAKASGVTHTVRLPRRCSLYRILANWSPGSVPWGSCGGAPHWPCRASVIQTRGNRLYSRPWSRRSQGHDLCTKANSTCSLTGHQLLDRRKIVVTGFRRGLTLG